MILKTKAELKERPDNIIVILGLRFLLIDLLSFGEGWVRLKLNVQGQGCGRILEVACQGGRGSRKLDNFRGRYVYHL